MNCNLIYRLLSEMGALLPDRSAQWLHTRWLEPHARHCPRCRTQLRRLARLDGLFRDLPATEALNRVMPAPVLRSGSRRVASPWPRFAMAGVTISVILVSSLLIRERLGTEKPYSSALAEAVTPHRSPAVPVSPSGGQSAQIATSAPSRSPATTEVQSAPMPASTRGALAGTSAPVTESRFARPQPVPDSKYLAGEDPVLTAGWLAGDEPDPEVQAWLTQKLPPVHDDFVRVPLPQVAVVQAGVTVVGQAARKYEEEVAVVDVRLFQKVKLQLKGVSLTDLCAELGKQAGVALRPSRGVQDEKVTVFVKATPARDVMREVARLFGYHWGRTGEAGAYKYELVQDLRSQLAEQEMRNRDQNAGFLALGEAMGVYRPYVNQTVPQLKERLTGAQGTERERLSLLVKEGGWGAVQLFRSLSSRDVTALQEGQSLTYGYASWHRNRLPEEWKQPLLQSNRLRLGQVAGEDVFGGVGGSLVSEYPGLVPSLGLKIDRSELGQFTLQAEIGVTNAEGGGVGHGLTLAIGRSPATAKADNAKANQALRSQAQFQPQISLKPTPSCPRLTEHEEREPGDEDAKDPVTSQPHVTSADVWEEVHRATGLPIVADYYSRLHPVTSVTAEKTVLFDALCKVSDELGVRWKKDGNFLLARSTSYFWDKLKEVPNRTLTRWQEARQANGALSLEQVLEIAALSDEQLDSEIAGKVIGHCWNLPEWNLLGKGGAQTGPAAQSARPYYRLLALLGPEQLRRALQPEGCSFQSLNGVQQQEIARTDSTLLGTALHAVYAPAGRYVWEPRVRLGTDIRFITKLPVVSARTAADALTAAQRVDPTATREQIRRQQGTLALWFTDAQGEVVREIGKPRISLQP